MPSSNQPAITLSNFQQEFSQAVPGRDVQLADNQLSQNSDTELGFICLLHPIQKLQRNQGKAKNTPFPDYPHC